MYRSHLTYISSIQFNIFEGMEVHGVAEWVITGGRVVVEDGDVKVARGKGSYIPTPPFSAYVYDRVKQAEEELAKKNVAVKRTQQVFDI